MQRKRSSVVSAVRTIQQGRRRPQIPSEFKIELYAAARDKNAAWWAAQIHNRLGMQATWRAGKIEQFQQMLLQIQKDPFSDLGFRYSNRSNAQPGTLSLRAVAPLTFERATLLADMQRRIELLGPCDDQLAVAASKPGNDDLVGFATTAHICLDLRSTDKKLIEEFQRFLHRHRRKVYCPEPIRTELGEAVFERWAKYRVLACFDLQMWAETSNVTLGPTALGEWLGVGCGRGGTSVLGRNAADFYNDKLLPAYNLAFSPTTHETLFTLA